MCNYRVASILKRIICRPDYKKKKKDDDSDVGGNDSGQVLRITRTYKDGQVQSVNILSIPCF